MPVMTGYEAADAIRASKRVDADIPIIAMTAFYTEQQAIQAGCNAVISKPYSVEKLRETIESYIG